jgi:protocatechuate 3,4-dioxygenase beta subunit
VAGQPERAKGRVLHVTGRVLDPDGRPVPGARVEIWQTNAFGRYHHPGDRRDVPIDPGFQGYGQDTADADGGYRFRTVEPVAYPAGGGWMRPPHIHFAVSGPGFERIVTQMYFAGDPLNARDRLLNAIRDPAERARLVVALQPPPPDLDPDSRLAQFDIVLGGEAG